MTTALTVPDNDARGVALLKAVGLDRVQPEQRDLALAIADRYGLDVMLKHLVMVEGKPYITRDGLLHVAHRSGLFDGIEVSRPQLEGEYWTASCTVFRRDMTRGFTYHGRYPAKGGNARFAPEMAVKVSEVMALRRAFDISAPVVEERWDMEAQGLPAEPPARQTLADRARAAVSTIAPKALPEPQPAQEPDEYEDMEAIAAEVFDAPEPVAPSVTSEALTAWMAANGIEKAYAASVAAEMFPGVKRLNDEQRAVLQASLEARR